MLEAGGGGLLWAVGQRRAVEWFNSARHHGGVDFYFFVMAEEQRK